MHRYFHVRRLVGVSMVAAGLVGCASTQQPNTQADALRAQYESRIKQKESQIDTLEASLSEAQAALSSTSDTPAEMPVSAEAPLLPPQAKPGECYARVYVPPKYASKSEELLKTAASKKVQTIPAKFEMAEETVLVREASSRLEVIPATYGWETEEVLVKPASTKLVAVPAQYETQTERLLIKPEHTIWKKGSGPITKINEITGEIMCLVTVPAEYKTVTKKVLVAEATTKEIAIPAEYKTVKKKVMVTPPSTRTVEIPAEYKAVKVRKMVAAAASRDIEIPATYQTITSREKIADGYLEWRSILCETNMTAGVITSMQSALKREGHYNGPIDGIVGNATVAAVRSYQQRQGLPTGGITMDMLKKLKVSI